MNLKRHSTTIRLSTGVAALTVSVLLAAQALGLIPDATAARLRGRGQLCEAVAIHCSLAAQRADVGTIHAATRELVARDPDILSAAVRRPDGTLLVEAGDHAFNWKAPPGDDVSTPTYVRVPIFSGDHRWGTVEIAFKDADAGSGPLAVVTGNALLRLALFVAAAGFLAYLIYLRRSLQYLDPAAVIPDRVKAMLDTLAEGVLVLDDQERIVLANRAFAAAVGEPAGDLTGVPASRFGWTRPNAEENNAADQAFPWAEALHDGATRTGAVLCLKRGDEDLRTFTVNCGPILGGDGTPRGALATFDDVTPIEKKNVQLRTTLEMLKQSRDEINRQNQELQALATTDPLTGCLNRRSFFAAFESQWASARRYGYKLSCVMVDVDRFKRINDQHGHTVGDQVLQHVASVLKSLAREGDVVCRYGGEEFCVLLSHTDADGAAQAAERYRNAIETRPCGAVSATASLGVSALELGARTPQELIDQADRSLYAAKQTGRNRVVRFDRMPADLAGSASTHGPAKAGEVAAAAAEAKQPPVAVATPLVPSGPVILFRAVAALTSALRYRDAATADHSQRVADLCVMTAKDLVSVGECFVLEVAALLHDIGKLGVPDAILLKPGPLTDKEWQTMRTHDRMGAEIVAAAFGSDELTGIVQTHHAWFGGSPRDPGLPTGTEIPLRARILTIADAYDAMTTDRVYRKGRSRDEAFKELRRCAGQQFDPELVERFIRAVTAADAGRAKVASEAERALERVKEQIERLACALDSRDMTLLKAMAGRLVATAGRDGLDDVAKAAADLEKSTGPNLDVLDVVKKMNDLVEICRSATAEPAPGHNGSHHAGATDARKQSLAPSNN